MTSEPILYEKHGNWCSITLNRPDKLNSFNAQMRADLAQALENAEADEGIRAVLLTGAGRGFCAGQDLSEDAVQGSADAPPNLAPLLSEGYNPIVAQMMNLPKPIVCAVNGTAAGAGANLALACDIVIAAKSAKFIQAFSKIGLVPDSGGTWLLPRLVGQARARALSMLGNPIDAQTAEQWGMIHQCVEDDDLAAQGKAMVQGLADAPTAALGRIKKLLLMSEGSSLEQQLAEEAVQQGEAGKSADHAEGVQAFAERRAPKFVGK